MSYSTRAEVRDMVKDDALNAIIGDTFIEDPAEREELVSPIIDAAIADADAEIDGYLAKRYAVPLAPAPRVINKFSKDIAVYNLFSRIGIDEGTDQKTYLNRYNAAIKFLTLVAEGTVSIGTETEDPASAAAGGFKVMLQATMGGAEAGTKYKAFLRSATKGGEALGLKFTDANNQLLSMPERSTMWVATRVMGAKPF